MFIPFAGHLVRGRFEGEWSMTVPAEGFDTAQLEVSLLEGTLEVVIAASEDTERWSLVRQRCAVSGASRNQLPAHPVRAAFVRVQLAASGRAIVSGGGVRLGKA